MLRDGSSDGERQWGGRFGLGLLTGLNRRESWFGNRFRIATSHAKWRSHNCTNRCAASANAFRQESWAQGLLERHDWPRHRGPIGAAVSVISAFRQTSAETTANTLPVVLGRPRRAQRLGRRLARYSRPITKPSTKSGKHAAENIAAA